MQYVAALIDVVTIVLLLWKFLKPAAKKILGLGVPAAAGAVGSKAAVTGVGAVSRFPKWFVSLFEQGGKLRWLRDIAYFLKNSISAPIILGITFLLSAFAPTVFEKLFFIIGAVFAKFGLMLVKWATNMVGGMHENNTEELIDILGDSAQALPACSVDVLGYLHMVEDLGMIIATLIFVGLYNLIKHFYFKFI